MLNFPAHFYTPQRKTNTMEELLQLVAEKKKIIETDKIAEISELQLKMRPK